MTTDEFEELLEGAEETDVLEFKQAMEWETGLVKDILAMANIQDGGRIVVGIEDQTLAKQGLTAAQAKTFNSDELKDKVGVYADPFVDFTVEEVQDRGGLSFIVISVAPFALLPVICKKDGGKKNELHAGAIYFRTRTRRPSSIPVSNASDMRDILDRATVLRMRHLQALGLQAVPANSYAFDKELAGL